MQTVVDSASEEESAWPEVALDLQALSQGVGDPAGHEQLGALIGEGGGLAALPPLAQGARALLPPRPRRVMWWLR